MVKFSFEMTIKELVDEMNSGGTQKDLYALSKIHKDVLPFLFKAAGYTREKQKYVAEDGANTNITIENLLPLAKELHKQAKIAKLTNESVAPKVVVLEAQKPQKKVEIQALTETNVGANVIDFSNKEQMQNAILEVLDLTMEDLEAVRSIGQHSEVAATTEKVSIFEEIKKLSGRDRANKTYFMSKELSGNIKEYADDNNIKVSQIIEIAIIDFLKKY
ncbi:hypothetical protein PB01_20850 (plasmid) [Psychrobacillus glaciei]|uniref:Uncharacterized protein n=1 Tax=Psychrobacillus glaciei TaxID=2283160 RepID=A0A5J6ST77_9BACI|nr:hypothetical protein [Psychrobacillus glaciei]QFG01282.1 hypothetical protein PB01_20850 [Psychrobacillus glaciei]